MNWKLPRRELDLVLCLLAVNAIALFPLLTTGYLGDDIFNSQIRGEMIQTHRSLWGVTAHYVGMWITNEGRLIPLAYYLYAVFYAVKSVFLYKLLVLTIVLASLAAFFIFLKRFTGSAVIPSSCLLLFPLIVQFRSAWDPILGFCAQYPLQTFLFFGSLSLFVKFLDDHGLRSLAVAIILFLCCGLIFETSYLMCLVYIVVAFSRLRKPRAALVASWPFLAVTGGLIATSFLLRRLAKAASQVYAPSFDLARDIRAYAVQSFGAVPFSYYWVDPHGIFSSQVSRWPAPILQGLPLLVVLASIAVFVIRSSFSCEVEPAQMAPTIDVLVVGILLFAMPQVLISLSPKYQEMPWGTAYLPVYISCFGSSLLLTTLLVQLWRRVQVLAGRKSLFLGICLILWTWLFALNLRNNWLLAISENEYYWYPRVLTEEALKHGLIANISPESILLVSGTSLWDNANEYSGKTNRRLSVYRMTEVADLVPAFQKVGAECKLRSSQQVCEFRPEAPVYTVQIRHNGDGKGTVLLAHLSGAYQVDNKIVGLVADKVTAYFRMPGTSPPPQGTVSGQIIRPQEGTSSLFRAGEEDCTVLKGGRGWELLSLRRDAMFDALSLQGDISPPVSTSTFLVAKSQGEFELRPPGLELFHQGFIGHMQEHGTQQPPISFTDEMSIDVLVTPGTEQVPNANILSNHGGDFRGIAIEQRGNQTNQYSIALGSGKEWMYAGDFSLKPARQNYISLQVRGKESDLYVNGALVAHKILVAPIASTDRPIYLGNWIGGDRQFNGLISEVLIAKGTRSAEEVRAESVRLLDKGAARSGGK